MESRLESELHFRQWTKHPRPFADLRAESYSDTVDPKGPLPGFRWPLALPDLQASSHPWMLVVGNRSQLGGPSLNLKWLFGSPYFGPYQEPFDGPDLWTTSTWAQKGCSWPQ